MNIRPIETVTLFQIDGEQFPAGLMIERLQLKNSCDEFLICHSSGAIKMLPIENKLLSFCAPKHSVNSEALKIAARQYF